MRRFCGALLIATGALLATTGMATAALPAGALSQLPFPSGCFASAAIGGCSTAAGIVNRPINIAVTADGSQVYVLGQSGFVRALNRDAATGVLTSGPLLPNSLGGNQAQGLAISGDGTRVAVSGGDPSGDGRLSFYSRAADGTLTLLVCADDDGVDGCLNRDGMAATAGMALPPSGPGIYAAGEQGGGDGADANSDGDGALVAFHAAFSPITQSTTLTQDACIPAVASSIPDNACQSPPSVTPAVGGVTDVAVSPDGATVYAGGFAGLVGFARNEATGALATRVACVLRSDGNAGCGDDARMGIVEDIALDPGGEHVYVAARERLVVFDRNPLSGGLTLAQCMKTGGGSGCADVPDLGGALTGITIAPDGRTAYVTRGGANHLLSLRRDPASGLLTPLGCLSFDADPGCQSAAGLFTPYEIAAAPNGGHVYLASSAGTGSSATGAVGSFRIAQAPVCRDAAVTVAADATAVLPLSCTDTDGDSLTLSIAGAPSAGALSAIDQGAGTVTYAAPSTAGQRTVSFSATDGVNGSNSAAIAITVTAAAAGPPPPTAAAAPRSRIAKIAARVKQSKLKRFSGTSTGPVSRVELSLVRLQGGARIAVARCQLLSSKGTLRSLKPSKKTKRCTAGGFLKAKGTSSWSLTLKKPLPKGAYVLTSRAIGAGTARETKFSATLGNRRAFKVV